MNPEDENNLDDLIDDSVEEDLDRLDYQREKELREKHKLDNCKHPSIHGGACDVCGYDFL